jgi:hypothetical protein
MIAQSKYKDNTKSARQFDHFLDFFHLLNLILTDNHAVPVLIVEV